MSDEIPKNEDAEFVLLGQVLNNPDTIWNARLGLASADFFDAINGRVYDLMLAVADEGSPPTVATLSGRVSKTDESRTIDRMLDAEASERLMPPYVEKLADEIRVSAIRRRMIVAASVGVERLKKSPGDGRRVISDVGKLWAQASADTSGASVDGPERYMKAFRDRLARPPEDLSGASTGFGELDDLGVWLSPGSVMIVAARPSMGKSALMTSMIANLALTQKKAAMLFSLEVGKEDAVENILCAHSMTPHDQIRDSSTFSRAADEMDGSRLFINDSADISADDVRALTRVAVGRHGVEVVVVDYLQLLRRDTSKTSREREVAEQCSTLKACARENNVAMVLLCQLNRESDSRSSGRGARRVVGIPRLSDLRESGSIEQDADRVLMIHRAAYYEDQTDVDQGDTQEATIIVAKNRRGPVGRASLDFTPDCTAFRSSAGPPLLRG